MSTERKQTDAEAQIGPVTKEVLREIATTEAQGKVAKALRWLFKRLGLR